MSFFLDTDILSLFAKADAIDLLLRSRENLGRRRKEQIDLSRRE